MIELEALAAAGYIALKDLDETGCCQWTPESYSYSPIGQQKRFEQTARRGQRVSILGVWDPLVSLVFRHPDLGPLKALSHRSNLASF